MRRRPLTSAATLTAALAAVLTLPLAGTAHAVQSCAATATPPRFDPMRGGIHATGVFGCAEPAHDLFVEVCIEELFAPPEGAHWVTLGCSSMVINDGGAYVTADVTVPPMIYSTVLRATVTGSNDRGETAKGSSVPVPFVNCACFIG